MSVESASDLRACIRERFAGTEPRHDESEWLVPGLTAQESRVFQQVFPRHPVPAAVLVALVDRPEGLTVLLTQRGAELKRHAGQISFPGGHIESDETARDAALREAREEIGLEQRFISIVGYLPDHILLTGYRVTPVIAFVQPGFELMPHAQEVEEIFEVPLTHVFEPANHRSRRYRPKGAEHLEMELHDIPWNGRNIWGATAGMLVSLVRVCAPQTGGGG